MENFYEKKSPIKNIDEINKSAINDIYKEPGMLLSLGITKVCLKASKEEIEKLFKRLGDDLTLELINIMCNHRGSKKCRNKETFTFVPCSEFVYILYRNKEIINSFRINKVNKNNFKKVVLWLLFLF